MASATLKILRSAAPRVLSAAAQTSGRRAGWAVAGAAGAAGATLYTAVQPAQAEWYNPLTWFGSSDPEIPAVWDAVRAEMVALMEEDPTVGPTLIRLAWHSCGSYSKEDGTGGSPGATMRFAPESEFGANAGLHLARGWIEPIKAAHPELSYADLYTFGGKVAVEHMSGPTIDWAPGRTDLAESEVAPTPDGRLPDGALGAEHLRDIFYRMGFDDREIVALSGAHCLGFCHTDRSGFSGPWTHSPFEFNNQYFVLMKDYRWELKNWDGPAQYTDVETMNLMMLPSDMALLTTPAFRAHVDRYYKDGEAFAKEFSAAFSKLLELGVARN